MGIPAVVARRVHAPRRAATHGPRRCRPTYRAPSSDASRSTEQATLRDASSLAARDYMSGRRRRRRRRLSWPKSGCEPKSKRVRVCAACKFIGTFAKAATSRIPEPPATRTLHYVRSCVLFCVFSHGGESSSVDAVGIRTGCCLRRNPRCRSGGPRRYPRRGSPASSDQDPRLVSPVVCVM